MAGFKSVWSYDLFANRVRQNFRLFRTEEDEEFLREVLRTSEARARIIPEGSMFWRAQLGSELEEFYDDCGQHIYNIHHAYPPKRMKPLTDKALEGRVNARGIPVLYMSTEQNTAMSEVRPWIGSYVSCAQFRINKQLRVVDLTGYQDHEVTIYMVEPGDDEREQAVWTHMGRAFSVPTTRSDDVDEYAPTQLISELFKDGGYDGIVYKSNIGEEGYNVALFDPKHADVTYGTLFRVSSVNFSFFDEYRSYRIDDGGRAMEVSIEDILATPQEKNNDVGK